MPPSPFPSRYGLFLHLSVATVPAFAPRGEYAEWYASHLADEPLADVLLHPAPMPEVQAWHAEHHPGLAYDDFIPGLTLERFDADALAALAVEAGMGDVVQVTKHHDGYCFWDSSLTDRTSARSGPHRDLCAEVHDACHRSGLAYGVYHSLLDWARPDYPDRDGYVEGFLHRQVDELVERLNPYVLWGDGHWAHTHEHWGTEAIRASYGGLMNDRWGWGFDGDFATPEYEVPDPVPDRPWELCRGLGHSFGYNAVEGPEDHLSARDIVHLLAEVVAKGGRLLLNIGPRADGTIPELQAAPLREAGRWVRAHRRLVDDAVPWFAPPDDAASYAASPDGRTVWAVDRLDRRVPSFAGFATTEVHAVHDRTGHPLRWRRDGDALVVESPRWLEGEAAVVYEVDVEPSARPVVVTPPREDRVLGAGEVLRDEVVTGDVLARDVDGVRVEGCTVRGRIVLTRCSDATVAGNRLEGNRWGVAIEARGGTDLVVEANEIAGALCAIRLRGVARASVEANRTTGRWWGIHLDGCTDATVATNVVRRTMRAYTVTGGSGHRLSDNVAEGCDTGLLTEEGATDVVVDGHRAEGCRVTTLSAP